MESLLVDYSNVVIKVVCWIKKLLTCDIAVSKERLERLVKNKILSNLDFTDLGVCVDCFKGKQTEYTKKGAIRST